MGSTCLSAASILRCESNSRLQAVALLIPTSLELIFSASLLFINWGTSRRHLLLAAESWVYFALALLDMLSKVIPAARGSLKIFKITDTILAATSSLPVLFYVLFIFLFAYAELIDNIPLRLQTVTKSVVFLVIPLIIVLNEVASFVGISYYFMSFNSLPVPVAGFRGSDNNKNKLLWTFFTSITLALLAAYQTIIFFLVFYRLVLAFLDQRRIEMTSSNDIHLLRGIGWIAGALQVGAIETGIGFVGGEFGGTLVRRILRMLARAFLCIGVGKGVDFVEDFELVRQEMLISRKRKELRRSRLREFISNPRLSTFQQLTPTATPFHAAQRLHGISPLASNGSPQVGMGHFAEVKQPVLLENNDFGGTPARRVTVSFVNGAPHLDVRISQLAIPSPIFNIGRHPFSTLTSSLPRRRSISDSVSTPRRRPHSSYLIITGSGAGNELGRFDTSSLKELSERDSIYSPRSVAESSYSSSVVRELTSQFPSLPNPVHRRTVEFPLEATEGNDFWDDQASVDSIHLSLPNPADRSSNLQPVSLVAMADEDLDSFNTSVIPSVLFKHPHRTLQVSGAPIDWTSYKDTHTSPVDLATPGSALATGSPQAPRFTQPTERVDDGSEPVTFLDLGTASDSEKPQNLTKDGKNPAAWIDFDAIESVEPRNISFPVYERQGEVLREGGLDDVPLHRESTDNDPASARKSSGNVEGRSKSPEVAAEGHRSKRRPRTHSTARIKSIGNAPMRSTPVPSTSSGDIMRNSVHTEPFMIPPEQRSNTMERI